jgi:hypothetical protein
MTTPQTTSKVPPLRNGGWPVRRMPMWTPFAALVLLVGIVLVSLSHKPSNIQQVADLNSYMHDMNGAVESCAGGVTESQQAFSAVESGAAGSSLKTALSLTAFNASNCTPASNEALTDLTQYQVTESLAKFGLAACTNDYVAWSFDAAQAQEDMATVLKASSATARASANATLQGDLRKMDAERSVINGILHSAEHTLTDAAPVPNLPS